MIQWIVTTTTMPFSVKNYRLVPRDIRKNLYINNIDYDSKTSKIFSTINDSNLQLLSSNSQQTFGSS